MAAPRFPDDPRVDRVLAVYDALQRRDWTRLQLQIAPLAVLRIGGRSRYAGIYRGLGQLVALALQFEERLIPFRSEIDDLALDEDVVRALVTVSIRVPPDDVFRARLRENFRFDESGLITELLVRGENQPSLDRFLG